MTPGDHCPDRSAPAVRHRLLMTIHAPEVGWAAVLYAGAMTSSVPLLATARTALFAPATRPDRVLKAAGSVADLVVVDLEDAVAAADKDTAREHLVGLLSARHEAGALPRPVAVRVNPPQTEAGRADLEALRTVLRPARQEAGAAVSAPGTAPDLLDAVLLPKLETVEQIRSVREALGGGVGIAGTVESAAGLLGLEGLAREEGLVRLAVGALDLAVDLGCSADSRTMAAALARVVMVSRALGLPGPLASPTPQFRDPGPAREAALAARADGFTGKLCIHPAQLAPVAEAFAPTEEEIAWARSVVEAADGATAVDGAMVDAPVIARARAVLSEACPRTADGSAADAG